MDFLADMLVYALTQCIEGMGASPEDLQVPADLFGAGSGFQKLWDYFMLLGIGMTIIYFLIEMNKRWALEGASMTFKNMFAPFLKLIIACVIMMLGADIFGWLLSFSNYLAAWSDTVSFTPIDGGQYEAVKEAIKKQDFWAKIILILPTILMYLVSLLCNLVWIYKAMLFKVELVARAMYAPIALSDVYSGNNANASRYIKGTVALLLYGASLVVLPKLVGSIALMDMANLNTAVNGDVLGLVLECVKLMIAPIAAIGLSSAARQITKEAVG